MSFLIIFLCVAHVLANACTEDSHCNGDGNGKCITSATPHYCQCPDGWAGATCEKEEADECRCIGSSGETVSVIGDNLSKAYELGDYVKQPTDQDQNLINGNYGEYCRAWDDPTDDNDITPYGACRADNRDVCGNENYCTLAWCYVTAACANKKQSDAFKDQVLYYSYDICGNPDCFASENNVGCPYGTSCPVPACPVGSDSELACGGVNGKQGDDWVGYAGARESKFGALTCVTCDEEAALGVVSFTGETELKCRVCPEGKRLPDDDALCTLPESQTGYKFDEGKRFTGACTVNNCPKNVNHVDVLCADNYELFKGASIEIDGCTDDNKNVTLRGCIPQGPATEWQLNKEQDKYLFTCKSDDDCSMQGFCDAHYTMNNPADEPGHCRQCPYSKDFCTKSSTTGSTIEKKAECEAKCFDGESAPERDACSGTKSGTTWIASNFVYTDCEKGEYCLLSATADGSTNKYMGVCQICEIVDPIGTAQCFDTFENDGSKVSCEDRCTRPGASERTTIDLNADAVDYTRWSSLENMVAGKDREITNKGFCGNVKWNPSFGMWGYETDGRDYMDICKNGWNLNDEKYDNIYEYTADANREIANDKCAERECEYNQDTYFNMVKNFPEDATFEGFANRCLLKVKNDGAICSGEVTISTALHTRYNLVGTCSNGQCLYKEGTTCPEGYKASTPTTVELNDCSSSIIGRTFSSTFHSNQANAATGDFSKIPHANKVVCNSHAHKDNKQWPIKDSSGTETATTGGTAQMSYEGTINGPVTERFNWMIFSQYYSWPTINSSNLVKFEPQGTSQTRTGLGIACDPNMDEALMEDYGCFIRDTGLYHYLGADIQIWENSNRTTRSYEITIEPSTFTFYNVFICPGVSTNRCMGGFECTYWVGQKAVDQKELCSGTYAHCIPTTFSPTMQPVPTSTAHGDPIIWTFNDECYDLNKDGLYVATANPKFNHVVKLGVYNDFMRELQVVSTNGEVLLSINSLGEYEKSDNFLYRFTYEEKECPMGMKDTECVGTYKEWMFDAQEFEYTVHLLRHDYKDNGIPEGDLGYHLDIYPRPYKSFREPGHMDSYSGLFFENPLPEELPYCVGGSNRNKNIKLEQSKPRDATVFA